MLSIISLCAFNTQAGFADSMRELRNSLGQFNETTKVVTGTAKDMTGFGANKQLVAQSGFTVGQRLYPKINNLPLYQSSNKSSLVTSKLSKNTDVIFAGNTNPNGLIEVTTEYGNGWVESHLVQ